MATDQEVLDLINSIDVRLKKVEGQVSDINLTEYIRKRRIDKLRCKIDNLQKYINQLQRGEHDSI